MWKANYSHRLRILICASALALAASLFPIQSRPARGSRPPAGSAAGSGSTGVAGAPPPAMIIGFLGGFVRHDNLIHSEAQLAARLRQEYPSGVDVETYESYRGENARKRILSVLDTNRDGNLTPGEKQQARIILYGHSWGASEAITVARELGKDGIPVLLTVQVDSVAKIYQNDEVIPPNVEEAANFYQPDGWVHGQAAIRAADPARTKIIGNFRFNYRTTAYACGEYPWRDRFFVKAHTQIECDPNVWRQAEDLIRSNLSPAPNNSKP